MNLINIPLYNSEATDFFLINSEENSYYKETSIEKYIPELEMRYLTLPLKFNRLLKTPIDIIGVGLFDEYREKGLLNNEIIFTTNPNIEGIIYKIGVIYLNLQGTSIVKTNITDPSQYRKEFYTFTHRINLFTYKNKFDNELNNLTKDLINKIDIIIETSFNAKLLPELGDFSIYNYTKPLIKSININSVLDSSDIDNLNKLLSYLNGNMSIEGIYLTSELVKE